MTNGQIRTVKARRTQDWENILIETINKIEETGYPKPPKKTEVERLFCHHAYIKLIQKAIIEGFSGLKVVRPEVKKWMRGAI